LVALGLALGASLLFAKPYVPADSNAAGAATKAGHDTRGSEAQPPADPHC